MERVERRSLLFSSLDLVEKIRLGVYGLTDHQGWTDKGKLVNELVREWAARGLL